MQNDVIDYSPDGRTVLCGSPNCIRKTFRRCRGNHGVFKTDRLGLRTAARLIHASATNAQIEWLKATGAPVARWLRRKVND